jgi:hypothetical protein
MAIDIDPSKIVEQAAKEQTFRRRVVDLIGGVLKSDVPMSLKTFVIILLFLCMTASLVVTVLILHVVLTLIPGTGIHVEPMKYAAVLGVHGVLAVVLGFPLTMKMSSIEESRRLEADLLKVQSVKRMRRKAGGERAAQAH